MPPRSNQPGEAMKRRLARPGAPRPAIASRRYIHACVGVVLAGLVSLLACPVAANGVNPTFQSQPASSLGGPTPITAIPTRINSASPLDLAILANQSGGPTSFIGAYLGTPQGGFTLGTATDHVIALPGFAESMAAADLDRDGWTDLVVTYVQQLPGPTAGTTVPNGRILVVLNDRNGGYSAPVLAWATPASPVAPFFVLADVTGDGIVDIGAVDRTAGTIHQLIGNGLGGFTLNGSADPTGGAVTGLLTADFNADGRGDLLVMRPTQTSVFLAQRAAPFGYTPLASIDIDATAASLVNVRIIDVDQDGVPDQVLATQRKPAAVSNGRTGDAWVVKGVGGGVFKPPASRIDAGPAPLLASARADLNGDGYFDFVALNPGTTNFAISPTTDTGARTPPVFQASSLDVLDVVAVNYDGDPRQDLVVVDRGNNTARVLVNTTPYPPPNATTGAPTAITTRSVTLNGTVVTKLNATDYWFEYGPTAAYGSVTPKTVVNGGRFSAPALFVLNDQFAGDTIHHRLVVSNRFGSSMGADAVATTVGMVGAITFRPKWTASRQFGRLEIKGLPTTAGVLEVVVRSADGKGWLRKFVRTSPRKESVKLRLPAGIPPGFYNAFVTGPDAAAAPLTQIARLQLGAPRTGYVRAYFTADGRRVRGAVRHGVKSLVVNYDIVIGPSVRVPSAVQHCTGPRVRPVAARRRFVDDLQIGLVVATRASVPRGTYTCNLKVGTFNKERSTVARVSIRVR